MTDARARAVGGAVAWNAAGTGAAVLVGLAAAMVQTRALGAAGYGRYAYLAWLAEAGGTLAALGLPRPIARFLAAFKREGAWAAARRASARAGLSAFVAGAVLGLAASRVSTLVPAGRTLVGLVPIGIAAVAAQNVVTAALQGGFGFKAGALASLASAGVLLGGSLLVALRRGDAVSQFVVAVLATGTSLGIGTIALRRLLRAETPAADAGRPVAAADGFASYWRASAALTLIEMVVWQRSEMYFLSRFSAPEQAAYYTAGFAVASRLAVVPQLFAPVLLSTVAGLRSDESEVARRLFAAMTRWLALLCAPLYLVSAALALPLARTLFGPAFASAAPPLAILLVGGLVPAVAVAGSAVMYGTDRMGFVLRWGAAAAVVTLAADILLIPGHGARSAALANLSGQLFATVVTFRLSLRPSGFVFPWAGVLRAAAAATVAAATGGITARALAGPGGLLLGGAAAAAVYLLGLRALKVFEPSDQRLFSALGDLSPAFARPTIAGAGRWLLPAPPKLV